MKAMFRPGSLRLRFLVAISLWVCLGIGAIWVSAVSIFARHVEQSYHQELEVHVRELSRLTEFADDGRIVLTRPLSDPRYDEPLSGFYWQVTADGHPPLRSGSMTRGSLDEDIAHSPAILHTLQKGPTGLAITYGFTRKGPAGEDIHFVIATDQRELDRLIDSFTRVITDEAERMAERPGCAAGAKARRASGQPYAARRVRLPDLAQPIIRAMERLHPDKVFRIAADNCPDIELPLDAVDYAELLSILLDNAGKWAHHAVTLTFTRRPDGVISAIITDDGPGMNDDELARAFTLGTRFDPDMPGSGLGLAIARDLADAMNLKLRLERQPMGLAATVEAGPFA